MNGVRDLKETDILFILEFLLEEKNWTDLDRLVDKMQNDEMDVDPGSNGAEKSWEKIA
jgi:hypothetical protein